MLKQTLEHDKQVNSFSLCDGFDDVLLILAEEKETSTSTSLVRRLGLAGQLVTLEDLLSVFNWVKRLNNVTFLNPINVSDLHKHRRLIRSHHSFGLYFNYKLFHNIILAFLLLLLTVDGE